MDFSLSPQPAMAMCIRLTRDMKDALIAAQAAGQALSLQLFPGEAGTASQAYLGIGGEQHHAFGVAAQNYTDLLQLPVPGRAGDAQVIATVLHKLQPKRTMGDAVSGRVRAAGEEAARRKQEGAAVRLGQGGGLPRQVAGPTQRTTTVQRQATPPPAAGTPPLPRPAASPATATAPIIHPPRPLSAPPIPVSAQTAAAPKKVLQPPKPGSIKAPAVAKASTTGAATVNAPRNSASPPHVSPQGDASGSTGPAVAPPSAPPAPAAPVAIEVPPSAIQAAKQGDLQLVVVACLTGKAQQKGLPATTLMRCIEMAYKSVKRPLEAKEYVKRVLDAATDRAPPGNRLVLKQEVLERDATRLTALNNVDAAPSPPTRANTTNKASRAAATPPPSPPITQQQHSSQDADPAAKNKPPAAPGAVAKSKKRPASSAAGLSTAAAANGSSQGGPGAARPVKKMKSSKPGTNAATPGVGGAGQEAGQASAGGGSKPSGEGVLRSPPITKARKAVRHVKGISEWDEDERDVHGLGWGGGMGGGVAGVSGGGDWDMHSGQDGSHDMDEREWEDIEPGETHEQGGDQVFGARTGPTSGLDGVRAPPPPPIALPQPPSGTGALPPPIFPPARGAHALAAPSDMPATHFRDQTPPMQNVVISPPAVQPSPSPVRSGLDGPQGSQQQQADDDAWAAVHLVEDAPSDAAEYAEFLVSPPPSPAQISHITDMDALANLEQQYMRYHALQFKIKQKYNQAMVELQALDQAVSLAAEAGEEDVAARRRRELWVRGAGYYLALKTWRRVLRGVNNWLEGARKVVCAAHGQAN